MESDCAQKSVVLKSKVGRAQRVEPPDDLQLLDPRPIVQKDRLDRFAGTSIVQQEIASGTTETIQIMTERSVPFKSVVCFRCLDGEEGQHKARQAVGLHPAEPRDNAIFRRHQPCSVAILAVPGSRSRP
jgi:hypothetical protein